jgi:hypothetical protein
VPSPKQDAGQDAQDDHLEETPWNKGPKIEKEKRSKDRKPDRQQPPFERFPAGGDDTTNGITTFEELSWDSTNS